MVRYGTPVHVPQGEVVDGDVVAFGAPVDIEGEVRGDVTGFGGPITISGHVTGDVTLTGGPLDLKDGARIDGDAVAIGGPLNRGTNVTIGGDTNSIGGPVIAFPWSKALPPPGTTRLSPFGQVLNGFVSPVARGVRWLFSTITLLLLAGLVTLMAPRAANTVAMRIEEEPLRVAFFGIVGWLLLLPVLFVLVILILTWILVPFVVLAFVVLLLIGCVGVFLYGGRRLAHMLNWRVTSLVMLTLIGLGALRVAGLVSLLPYGEYLVAMLTAAVLVMGLGAALMTRFGTDPSGTWLGRHFRHNGRHNGGGWAHVGPAAPTPAPTPAPPRYEHDLDDKTLEALRDLPADEGDDEERGERSEE